MSRGGSWRNLEQRVAQYFERNGYTSRTNQPQTGRSGLVHEIDVLAEKQDAAGTHRVAVECKAWRAPVEKDVIYKLEKVMQDTGLSKGIVVSVGGLRAGARTAAEQAHIEVWGPDEIRHYLGDEALAGLPLAAPDEALGVEVAVDADSAERDIRKARSGFAGMGSEEITSIELLWVPAIEMHLAVTRVRPGLVRDREELVGRWALFEALTGRLIGARDEPRDFVAVQLDGAALRRQKGPPQIVSDLRRTLSKHRTAKSDAAQKRRQEALNAVGLPGSTREFAVEEDKDVFVPFYVGFLRRKGSERVIAIHAGMGMRVGAVEQALHEKIDLVRRTLRDTSSAVGHVADAEPGAPPHAPATSAADRMPAEEHAACVCGAEMVVRHRKADGQPFLGCSTFPRCRHTRPVA